MNRRLEVEIGANNDELKAKVDDSKKSIGQLRQEFKRLSKTSFAGMNPQEIEAVNKRLAVLRDAIGDTNAKIKSLSLDPFQKMAETTQVATSVMAGMAGAATLAGGSQEELNKLMQKTVALMAIAKAAQEIATFTSERAAGIYLKNKFAEISANLKGILTINAGTAATLTQEAATVKLSAAQKVVIFLQNLWNKTVAANPIILLIAAVAALAAGLFFLGKAYIDSNKEAKSYEKTMDGVVMKNEKMRDIHNESITTMKKLQNEWDLLTGSINDFQKKVKDLTADYELNITKIKNDTAKQLDEASSSWFTWGKIIDAATNTTIAGHIDYASKTKDIYGTLHEQLLAAQREYNAKIQLLQKEEAQKSATAGLELNALTAKNSRERMNSEIAISIQQMEKEQAGYVASSNEYELAVAKHNDRVAKIKKEYSDKALAETKKNNEETAKINKENFDFMILESLAYWQQIINDTNTNGTDLMNARIALVEATTEQELAKVKEGSEQAKKIIQDGQNQILAIKREGFKYMINLQDSFNNDLSMQLQIAKDMNIAYGDSFDYIGAQMDAYKSQIDLLIKAGEGESEMVKGLSLAYQNLAAIKAQADKDKEKQTEAANAQIQQTDQLKTSVIDLAGSFGASMAQMTQSGADAARQMIKQTLSQVVALLIKSIMEMPGLPFPAKVALSFGAGAVSQALFSQVPALANSGMAYGPTLAMVGDNANAKVDPEVITPLSNLKKELGGMGNDVSQVEFIIKGDVLYGFLNKFQNYKNRYK